MPYQLNFAGNTTTLQRRIAPFPLPTNYTQDTRIDVTFVHATSGGYQAVLQTPETSTNNNNFFVGCAPSGVFYFWCNGSQLNSTVTPVAGQVYVISITIDTSRNVGISVNGSAYTYKAYPSLSASLYNQMLCGGTTNNAGTFRDPFLGQLRRVETWVGGVKTGDFTNSTGTGTTMIDSVGGGVATQAGTWPAGDAEWVFYSSGAYTLNADGATFSYSGGIASTIYSRILSADGGSFSYSGGVAVTLLNRRIAADGATFGYSGGVSALLYGRALQAAGGSFSYSGGVATFVYNPITGYVLNADGGIFSYAGGEAALSFNQNYPTANPNDYTVSAYLSTDSTYTARLSESGTINAIISASSTFNARLN